MVLKTAAPEGRAGCVEAAEGPTEAISAPLTALRSAPLALACPAPLPCGI